jgi:hypothetical protein
LQVYSDEIQKTGNTEKAYDMMMSILPQLADNGEMLGIFDWFLTQTKDFNEVDSKLNICIPFETEDLFNKQSYEPCQFPIDLHSRARIQDLKKRVESNEWPVPNDKKTLGNLKPGMFNTRFSTLFVFAKGIRAEDGGKVIAKT